MKMIIHENERGLLFKSGRFEKLLESGRYRIYGDKRIEVVSLDAPLFCAFCPLDILLRDERIARQTDVIEVADEQFALHFINGKFSEALRPGKYAFWNIADRHTFTIVNTTAPETANEIPHYIFGKLPSTFYTKIEVAEHQKGRLYFDQKLIKLLDAGTYYFWKGKTKVDYSLADTRLLQLNINGQEILTRDKVAIRINFVCNYRITDYIKIVTEIDNYEEQLHVAGQLALREFAGNYRIDEILEMKQQLGDYVFSHLKKKAADLYIDLLDAGVKDIILPGEIRDIMNTVLIAEKRAQANVIMRREEVASTRSLLNTAKLMDENQTLYRLKELEYLEKICGNVGNITVHGGADLLSQLTTVLQSGN